jgi:DNA-directed RNA polymerase I subunit RPA1
MAHRVRVLHNPSQKTIRMHYANCNTYNADYDGDELNCHFPQSELARSEAIHIARTDYQYIVPTDGTPLRGLIQDHVVGGVKLTKRDTFLEKWEYQQLIFAALSSLQGLEVVPPGMDIEIVPPAVLKPRELWTGKQVVTTLLLHLCKTNHGDSGRGPAGITLERKAKTPEAAFGPLLEEHLVLIRDGELLRGVLDKAAFGATDFSLVHGVYEAYGPEKAGILLNALGRLFTAYIQYFAGHSCRMEDLVLTSKADQDRRVLVERSYNQGARAAKAWADSDGGKVPIPPVRDQPNSGMSLKPDEAASAAAKIAELLTGTDAKHNHAALDAYMQSQLNPLSSEIVQKCLPSGLSVPFPYNSFSIMTVTGAKGSIVNQSQVSCALGQQALEGRRVPRMSSGRTLPSFAPFDPSPRADGFVMDRFLTGVRPQEYYFHCMAGREGLVDTAVKTSRSGYLQRCLVKHLEELTISYDFTVRNAEGGVVQFLYGEDGLDPTKASYLDCTEKSFDFMARNYGALSARNSELPNSTIEEAAAVALSCEAVQNGSVVFPSMGGRVLARRLRFGSDWKPGALCTGWHKATITKVRHNGKSVDIKYDIDGQTASRVPIYADLSASERNAGRQAASNRATIVKPAREDPVLSSTDIGRCVGVDGACVSEKIAMAAHHAMSRGKVRDSMTSSGVTREQLSRLVGAKYSSSLCAPGEAVGCIAAQSVGEPSTQMTLNTFHLAGSGANVTLGIPRLREVIMTAAREPKTPTMSVPLHDNVSDAEALRLTRRLTKLNLMELVASHQGVSVKETIDCVGGNDWMRNYIITIKLHPAERIREAFGISIHGVAAVIAKNFVPKLAAIMKTELRRSSAETDIIGGQSSEYVQDDSGSKELEEDVQLESESRQQENEEEVDDEAPTEEDGADASRYRQRSDSASYDDEEETGSDSGNEPAEGFDARTQSMTASANEPAHDAFPTMTKTANDGVSPVVNTRHNTITLQPLSVDPASPPLLMVDLVEKAATTTLLRSIKGIQEAYINQEDGRGRCLQTLGVNFEEVWKLQDVDHERLMSNDIWAIRCAYGVEAARSSIVNQITSVFGAYGIAVDPRHLSLIADYMTFDGGYKSMNRTGMEWCSSPFLQMSFETTVNFLKQSAVLGLSDDLSSPSGNVVMGRPVHHGTGSFDLLAGVSRQ